MRHAVVHDPPTFGARGIIVTLLKVAGLAALLTVLLSFPAFSQQLGLRTLELNTFGRYTDFAPAANLQSGVGGGLRLGYFLHPRWELEGGVGFTRVSRMAGAGRKNVTPVLLDVTYNLPMGPNQLLLSGGAVHNDYGSFDAWGTSLSAGVRLPFGRSAALRVDGTREYINGGDTLRRHSNWGFRLGLSWMLPKRMVASDHFTFSRGDLATASRVRMPLLRESNPVAIMALENQRAKHDSLVRQPSIRHDRAQDLGDTRIAVRAVAVPDRMGTTLHFAAGSSEIRADAVAAMEAKLDLLRGIPTLRIRIEGQADDRGSTADNIALAWTRAGAAKLWLIDHGIASDRIDAVGFSAGRPVCEELQGTCGSEYRRAEFVIVAGADAILPNRP